LARSETAEQVNLSCLALFSALEYWVASLLPLHNYYSILIRLLEPSSSEAGETSVRNKAAEFCLQSIYFNARKVLLHAVNPRHGTGGFTSPPKEVVLRIFITLKNPSSSAGFEPANLGSSGKLILKWQHRRNVLLLMM
jgi:hypothetical protein